MSDSHTEKNKLSFIQSESEKTRLLPSGLAPADDRVVSVLLACATAVPQYLRYLLKPLNISITKKTQVNCYIDPPFAHHTTGIWTKPHGLIVVKSASKTWSALIFARVGNQEIEDEHLQQMFDIALTFKVDAVVTFSSQSKLNKHNKPESIEYLHLSWMTIVNITTRCINGKVKSISTDQTYLLSELFRYFQDPDSQMLLPIKMAKSWRNISVATQNSLNLRKLNSNVDKVIANWHTLLQYLAFRLALFIEHEVHVYLSSQHKNNSARRLKEDKANLIETSQLQAQFNIPHAASALKLCADIKKETLQASMILYAPDDRRRATAVVGWLLKQLAHCRDEELVIRALWPNKTTTESNLANVRFNKKTILSANTKEAPIQFELSKIWFMHERMRNGESFVEDAETILPEFYSKIGQYLNSWIPPTANSISEVPTIKTRVTNPPLIKIRA